MNSVTVYSKPECPQCEATKKYLDKHEIEHSVIDVTENIEARVFVMTELGYQGVPVVAVTSEHGGVDQHWQGFRPDRIKALQDQSQYAQVLPSPNEQGSQA